MQIRKGDQYIADLSPVVGSEQGGVRPVLIIQNDIGNRYSPMVIVAAITSRQSKHHLPTHIPVGGQGGLHPDSMVLMEQVRTIDRTRLRDYLGRLDPENLMAVDQALAVSFGMEQEEPTRQMCVSM